MKTFAHKTAAITGAGSGIGRALALDLARRGCHLALADIDRAAVDETAALARAHGVRATSARVDVALREEVFAWADVVVREHGAVHLVVNNAGVALGATAEDARKEDVEWIMSINFWGVVHGTQAFLPHLRAAGEGHVVNVSSLFGLVAIPGQSAYNASKFAVRGFTEALRQELEVEGAPVSATCVHPGGVRTNIARRSRVDDSLKRLGTTDPASLRGAFERVLTVAPEEAAATILRAVERNQRRVLVGKDAVALDALQRLLPTGYQWLVTRAARPFYRRAKARPAASG